MPGCCYHSRWHSCCLIKPLRFGSWLISQNSNKVVIVWGRINCCIITWPIQRWHRRLPARKEACSCLPRLTLCLPQCCPWLTLLTVMEVMRDNMFPRFGAVLCLIPKTFGWAMHNTCCPTCLIDQVTCHFQGVLLGSVILIQTKHCICEHMADRLLCDTADVAVWLAGRLTALEETRFTEAAK